MPVLGALGGASARALGWAAPQIVSASPAPPPPPPPPVTYSQWADSAVNSSNLIGLSSTATLVGSDYVVTDTYGTQWKILANWGYNNAPTRWNGVVWRDAGNTSHVTSRVGLQTSTGSLSSQVTPGVLYRDATTFFNASGQGFSNWYTDSKGDQAYPNLITYFRDYYNNANKIVFDNVSNPDDVGGSVWFEPPANTVEVMMDFGNSHSNGPCSISVVDKTTGLIVKRQIWYGQNGAVNTSAGALNDPNTRTVVFRHQPNYVYFNTDHGGTISGSHYYLYR